jgi:hypothetical protein
MLMVYGVNIVVTLNMTYVILSKILVKEATLAVHQLLHKIVVVALGVEMIVVDVDLLYITKS